MAHERLSVPTKCEDYSSYDFNRVLARFYLLLDSFSSICLFRVLQRVSFLYLLLRPCNHPFEYALPNGNCSFHLFSWPDLVGSEKQAGLYCEPREFCLFLCAKLSPSWGLWLKRSCPGKLRSSYILFSWLLSISGDSFEFLLWLFWYVIEEFRGAIGISNVKKHSLAFSIISSSYLISSSSMSCWLSDKFRTSETWNRNRFLTDNLTLNPANRKKSINIMYTNWHSLETKNSLNKHWVEVFAGDTVYNRH